MTLRYTLSRLSRPEARRGFGRQWFWVCVVGACASLLAFGVRHAFFIATVWFLCIFAPVRIAVEVLHTAGPRIRRRMQRDLEGRKDRYTTRERITLRVEDLFGREVRLPRIAPPDLGAKATEAAVRLTERAFLRGPGPLGVLRAATTCGVLLDRWIGTIAAGEAGSVPSSASPFTPAAQRGGNGAGPPALWDAHASIQDQWMTLRAVAGLAALTKALTAVYEDSAGRPLDGGAALRSAAEAAMDYADQIGLRLEGPAWEDVSGFPRTVLSPEVLAALADTWTAFCAAPLPAPRRLQAFLETVPE
jgi:hypothetical protein